MFPKTSWEMQTKKLKEIQTPKKKQPKHNTKDDQQTTRKEREEKGTT